MAVTLPLVLTPGVSTAAVLRTSVMRGTPAALVTAAGLNASSVCYGILAALGLPAVARRLPALLLVLRYAGGAYVIWLGATALARGIKRFAASSPEPVEPLEPFRAPSNPFGSFVEGFVVNSLNPPVATFYLLILPQFVPPAGDFIRATLLLTAVHVSMALSWHVAWALAGGALAARLREGRPRATLEVITGVALTALGLTILL